MKNLITKTEAIQLAHEIGRDLRDSGRHNSDLARWATSYSYYSDIAAALSPIEAGEALHDGWVERDGEIYDVS